MSLEMHCMKAVKTIKFHFFFRKIKGSSILHIKAVKFLGNFSRFFLVYKYTEGQEGGGRSTLVVSPGEDNNLGVQQWHAIPLQIESALPKLQRDVYFEAKKENYI